jgi:hypothetical protein
MPIRALDTFITIIRLWRLSPVLKDRCVKISNFLLIFETGTKTSWRRKERKNEENEGEQSNHLYFDYARNH